MEDDQETGNNSPEDTSRLVGNSASFDIVAVNHSIVTVALVGFECVDSLDVGDHDQNGARKDQDEGNQTEDSDGVQAHKLDFSESLTSAHRKMIRNMGLTCARRQHDYYKF